jgi:hypothetical protein
VPSSARPGSFDVASVQRMVLRRALDGDPLMGSKGLDRPGAIEPPDTGILLAPHGLFGQIEDQLIVDMRHADLEHLVNSSQN